VCYIVEFWGLFVVVNHNFFPFVSQTTGLGNSCTASSKFGTSSIFACDAVYDGFLTPDVTHGYTWYSANGDTTPYVEIAFSVPRTVGRVTVYNACWSKEQCLVIKFGFSDGSEQTVRSC
jgi:hypothetical protein